jgi:hypothetical protein
MEHGNQGRRDARKDKRRDIKLASAGGGLKSILPKIPTYYSWDFDVEIRIPNSNNFLPLPHALCTLPNLMAS